MLKVTHRGYIIPPRPEKNTVEGQRASEDFVAGRKVAIERYLNSLAAHPVIGESQVSIAGLYIPERYTFTSPIPHAHKGHSQGTQKMDFVFPFQSIAENSPNSW